MKNKLAGAIFFVMGLLGIIFLSMLSTFKNTLYTDTNHFIGFMNEYGLWAFFRGYLVLAIIGFIFLIRKDQ